MLLALPLPHLDVEATQYSVEPLIIKYIETLCEARTIRTHSIRLFWGKNMD